MRLRLYSGSRSSGFKIELLRSKTACLGHCLGTHLVCTKDQAKQAIEAETLDDGSAVALLD